MERRVQFCFWLPQTIVIIALFFFHQSPYKGCASLFICSNPIFSLSINMHFAFLCMKHGKKDIAILFLRRLLNKTLTIAMNKKSQDKIQKYKVK